MHTDISACTAATALPEPDTFVTIDRSYADRARQVLAHLEATHGAPRRGKAWSELQGAVWVADDDDESEARPGTYRVLDTATVSWSKAGAPTVGVVIVENLAAADPEERELYLLAGLCQVSGGAIARTGGGGILAATGKGARGLATAAAQGAKSVAKKTGQIALAEGKRKAAIVAEEVGGDTLYGAHETAKDVAGKLLEAFGFERAAPIVKAGIDFAGTSGARMLGAAFEETSPKVAAVLKTYGNVVERKQGQRAAEAIRKAAAPMLSAMAGSLGEGVGKALAPMLQAAGALPPAQDEPADDDADVEAPAPKPTKKTGKKAAKKTGRAKTKPAPQPEPEPQDDGEDDADAEGDEE